MTDFGRRDVDVAATVTRRPSEWTLRLLRVVVVLLGIGVLLILWYRSLYDVQAHRAMESAEADLLDLAVGLEVGVTETRSFPADDAAGWEPSRETRPEAHGGIAIVAFEPLSDEEDLARGTDELIARFRALGWEQVRQRCRGSSWTLGFSDGAGRGTVVVRGRTPLDDGWQLEIWLDNDHSRHELTLSPFDTCFS